MDVVEAGRSGALGGLEGQLVDGQGPRRPLGHDQGDAFGVALLDVLHDAEVGLVGMSVVEGRGVIERGNRASAGREQERVVAERLAAGRVSHLRSPSTHSRVSCTSSPPVW